MAAAADAAVRVGVVGCSGRLGNAVLQALAAAADLQLGAVLARDATRCAALRHAGHHATCAVDEFCDAVALIVDCSAPAACRSVLPVAAARQVGYLLASTDLTAADRRALTSASGQIGVVEAANLSCGVALLAQLTQRAAAALPHFDVRVLDVHHRAKRDAPSGTARWLGAAAGADRQVDYAALRGGDVVGDHTVYFCGPGERLELTHRSTSPQVFGEGALRALRFLRRAAPGLYTMQDVVQVDGDGGR